MNELEVIQDLRSYVKPYAQIKMPQSHFSNVLTRYEAGLLKPKTLVKFLSLFGYEKENGVFVQKTIICTERKIANGK
jgi:hypothetical protein